MKTYIVRPQLLRLLVGALALGSICYLSLGVGEEPRNLPEVPRWWCTDLQCGGYSEYSRALEMACDVGESMEGFLIQLLTSSEPADRRAAAAACCYARSLSPRTVSLLVRGLHDSDSVVQRRSARALGRLAEPTEEVTLALLNVREQLHHDVLRASPDQRESVETRLSYWALCIVENSVTQLTDGSMGDASSTGGRAHCPLARAVDLLQGYEFAEVQAAIQAIANEDADVALPIVLRAAELVARMIVHGKGSDVEQLRPYVAAIAPFGADAIPFVRRLLASDAYSASHILGLECARVLSRDCAVLSPDIIWLAEHGAPRVRVLAIRALGTMGDAAPNSVPTLLPALGSDEPVVSRAALGALARMPNASRAHIAAIEQRILMSLGSQEWRNTPDARSDLLYLQHGAEGLWSAVQGEPDAVRAAAWRRLIRLPLPSATRLEVLARALQAEGRRIPLAAARELIGEGSQGAQVLARVAKSDEGLLPVVARAVDDWATSAGTSVASGQTLEAFTPSLAVLRPTLLACLHLPSDRAKGLACRALGWSGVSSDEAVTEMIGLLESQDPSVVQAAVFGLGRVTAGTARAIPALAHLLASRDWLACSVMEDIVEALIAIGPPADQLAPSALSYLALWREEADAPSIEPDEVLIVGLTRLARRSAGLRKQALLLAFDGSAVERAAAARIVAGSAPPSPSVISLLCDMLSASDACLRNAAVDTLNELSAQSDLLTKELAAKLRRSDSSAVRIALTHALRHEGGVPALREALQDHDARVRVHAVRCIGSIGVGARCALPELRDAQTDSTASVGRAARRAIAAILKDEELVMGRVPK